MNKFSIRFITLLSGVIFYSSCKKTIGLEPLPQNKILEYRVSNLPQGEDLYGAIDENQKTITVYVPFYHGLEIIDPEIKLSEGAKLSEEPEPVNINATDHQYIVIASDGTRNSYKLKIVQQNTPGLQVNWTLNTTEVKTSPLMQLPSINGNFFSNNAALAKVTLISRNTKKEVLLNTANANVTLSPNIYTTENNVYTLNNVLIPASIDTGYHDVRISFLHHNVTISKPVNIKYVAPRLNTGYSKVAKQGEEITFIAFPNTVILDPRSVKITTEGKTYSFPIKRYDFESITLQVPDDFPVGSKVYSMILEFHTWPSRTESTSLNINAK